MPFQEQSCSGYSCGEALILSPGLTGTIAGGLAGLVGWVVLELQCPNLNLYHILAWHWGSGSAGDARWSGARPPVEPHITVLSVCAKYIVEAIVSHRTC